MASGHEMARERDWAGNIDGDFDADAAMEAELAALVRASEAHARERGSRPRLDLVVGTVLTLHLSVPILCHPLPPVAFLSSIQTP